jgi:hypothetical protein
MGMSTMASHTSNRCRHVRRLQSSIQGSSGDEKLGRDFEGENTLMRCRAPANVTHDEVLRRRPTRTSGRVLSSSVHTAGYEFNGRERNRQPYGKHCLKCASRRARGYSPDICQSANAILARSIPGASATE